MLARGGGTHPAQPRHLLVRLLVGARRPEESPPADPVADRPARPPEVPEDPRSAVRAPTHERAGTVSREPRQRADRRVRGRRGDRLRKTVLGAAALAGVP